jgi:hypothetical protein
MGIEGLSQLRDGAPLTSNKYLSLKGKDRFVPRQDFNRVLAWFRGRHRKQQGAVDFVKRTIDDALGKGFGETILKELGIVNRLTGQDLEQVARKADDIAAAQEVEKAKRPEIAGNPWRHRPSRLLNPPPPQIPPIPSQMNYKYTDKSRIDCVKAWDERREQIEGMMALIPGIKLVGLIKNDVWPQNGIPPLQFLKELAGNNSDIWERLYPMLTIGFLHYLEFYLPSQAQAASYQLQPGSSAGTFNVIKEPNNQYRAQLSLAQPIERAFDKEMDPFKSFREFNVEFLVQSKGFSIEKGPEAVIRLQPA